MYMLNGKLRVLSAISWRRYERESFLIVPREKYIMKEVPSFFVLLLISFMYVRNCERHCVYVFPLVQLPD